MISDQSTPCFIVDKEILKDNIHDFRKFLNKYFLHSVIGYSFKTNSLPAILSIVKDNDCYAEVVSGTEYRLAKAVGFHPSNIIYNGPIKNRTTFMDAIKNRAIVNIDSVRELQWLKEASLEKKVNVGLRVNFDLEALLPGQTTCGEEGGRFGFSYENGDLERAIQQCKEANVEVAGLHMHVSSKSKSVQVYKALTEKAVEISRKYDLSLSYLDIGGGFFGGHDHGVHYEKYIKEIQEVLACSNMDGLRLIVEPGASLIATAVSYECSVLETKRTSRNLFVLTDGSRLHIDPFFRKDQYQYRVKDSGVHEFTREPVQVICGYTCMENDRFMKVIDEKALKPGDRITFDVCGSYTMCFNSLFIEYLPRVYLKSDNKYSLVRQKWDIEQYLMKSEW